MIQINEFLMIAGLEVCNKTPRPKIKKMRNSLNKRKYRKLFGDKNGYILHHIIPLSLGGSNRPENLALVEESLEKAIHRYIDAQVKPELSERKTLVIPRMNGKVWPNPSPA